MRFTLKCVNMSFWGVGKRGTRSGLESITY